MAEFNLHLTVDANEYGTETVEQLLAPFVEAYESAEFGEPGRVSESNDGVLEATLEIDGVDVFAEIYQKLRERDDIRDIGLWGPTAERFPVPVKHYALQQISAPDNYEYYALDSQVTLVICDSQHLVEQLRMEVPPPALG